MTKPVILAVDDDAAVLAAIDRDLRAQYRADYRVLKAASPAEALEAARELAARNAQVALFVADQRMPGMTGLQLLTEVVKLHPGARKVLLTAYADTDVAIAGINEIALDHYLMKPWDPPHQRLYPVLDDLLGEWRARNRPAFEGVRVFGADWSPDSYAVREFLSRNQVPYEWVDLDRDAAARALAESLSPGLPHLPIVLFPDGTHLVTPSQDELAAKAGLQTQAHRPFYDVIIIGGGPAGLANAVYAATEGLRTLLVESHAPGGQAGTSSLIENYLGFPAGVTGADLAQRATAQAKRFGAEIVSGEVRSIKRTDPYRVVTLANGMELTAYTVVIATGMSARALNIPSLAPLQGRGVFYGAAMSEAASNRGNDVVIVGGANSAGQAALFFARYARRVYIVVRAASLRDKMSHYLADRIAGIPNIEAVAGVDVVDVATNGGKGLSEVIVATGTGERRAIPASAMFIFIGVKPHTEWCATSLEVDDKGFIVTGADLPREHGRPRGWTLERDPMSFETSIPGVFAAGDVRSGANRRVAAAVGEGSAAIYSVQQYLKSV